MTDDAREPSVRFRPVYGPRTTAAPAAPVRPTGFERTVGPPPPDAEVATAERKSLPSARRFRSRFRALALLGGVAVLAVSAGGLWLVARLAFG